MAERNAVVGVVTGVAREEARGFTIQLEQQPAVRLNPADNRSAALAEVFEDLRARSAPAYVEVDPASGFVTRVRIPNVVKVANLTVDAAGNANVTYEFSQARHVIKKGSADYENIVGTLRGAHEKNQWLLVTPDDGNQILDVRPYTPRGEPPRFEPAEHPEPIGAIKKRRCVSKKEAQRLFNLVAATTCNPTTVPPPCIPFLYPDDGCWGRAHEMCRLMIAAGADPRKVWIYGNLNTPTRNNPNCHVLWGWHVAPTLCVKTGLFSTQEQVIDPSLFTTPVSQATWKAKQGDPSATLVPTSAAIFHRSISGLTQTDPSYTQTNIVLANYRNALRTRSLSSVGPPPYANCP